MPIEEASRLVAAAGIVIAEAEAVAARAAGAVSRAEATAGTAQELLSSYAGPLRDAGHGEAHKVVGQRQSPEFLLHALGSFAAKRCFFALEGMGLHFVEAELEFPALVVERDDLGGRISLGIDQ